MILRKTHLILLFLFFVNSAIANPLTDSVIVINAGKNGNSTRDLLKRVDKDVLERNPQVVVLMVGTNDIFYPKKVVDMETYKNNYQKLITTIRNKSQLVLMTIPPVYAPYIILRKPELKFKSNDEVRQQVDSVNLIIRCLAKKNNCQLIDLNKVLRGCGGANAEKDGLFQNRENFGIPDGVHPTPTGSLVIATAVYQALMMLNPQLKRVVCFGDSITCGYRLEGQGTVEGQTYPAVLKRLLNL